MHTNAYTLSGPDTLRSAKHTNAYTLSGPDVGVRISNAVSEECWIHGWEEESRAGRLEETKDCGSGRATLLSSANALITSPRVDSDKLILEPSLSRSPRAPCIEHNKTIDKLN